MKKKTIILCSILIPVLLLVVWGIWMLKPPDDALGIIFRSNEILEYDGKNYFLLKSSSNYPEWQLDSSELTQYGKAKITKEVWTTASNCRLNGYDSVYVGRSPEGEIVLIETNNSVWIDRECGEDFFSSDICKVLIVNLNAGSSNKYVGLEYTDDPFFKLADVNDCVPISSLNQSWIRRNELRFYSSTYPWLYYAFAEYVHEGSYYLGVRNIKGQYSFLIRIVDDALISELNK